MRATTFLAVLVSMGCSTNSAEIFTTPDAGAPADVAADVAATSDADDTGAVDAANRASSLSIVGDCDVPSTFPQPTVCQKVEVTCDDDFGSTGELRITPPVPNAVPRGTVILGSGGHGANFFAGSNPLADDGGLQIVRRLAMSGFRVVERRWSDGWFGPPFPGDGFAGPACLYRALLDEMASQTDEGAVCAYGNSGGSAEIGYALTRHGAEELIDAAILSGGPPLARLDLGCLEDAAWRAECETLWDASQTECPLDRFPEPNCTLYDRDGAAAPPLVDAAFAEGANTEPCTGQDASFEARFLAESVVAPGVDLDYGDTHVHFVVGRRDCTEAPILGDLYRQAIESSTSVAFIPNGFHQIERTPEGVDAVVDAFDTHCR